MRTQIAILLLAASTATASTAAWVERAQECVRLVNAGFSSRGLDSLRTLRNAEVQLASATPPSPEEVKEELRRGSPRREAALAAVAAHGLVRQDVVDTILENYRRSDSLASRYYGATVLGRLDREQVGRVSEALAELARSERGSFALAALAPALGKLDFRTLIPLLADLATGSDVLPAFMIALDAGAVDELKAELQARRSPDSLRSVIELQKALTGPPRQEK